MRRAKGRARARRAARFRARPPYLISAFIPPPLSHSAFRLTPFPIPSSRAAAPPPPRGATSPGLLNRRVLHRPTRGSRRWTRASSMTRSAAAAATALSAPSPLPSAVPRPPSRPTPCGSEPSPRGPPTPARTDPPAAAPPAAGVRAGVPSPAPRDSEEEARTRAPRYPARAYSNETPRAWTPYTSTMRASGMQPRRPRPHPRPRQGPRISPRRGPRMSPPRR